MTDTTDPGAGQTGSDYPGWAAEMRRRCRDEGFFEDLGPDHHAQLTDAPGPCLLVTFESFEDLQRLPGSGLPLGRDLAAAEGWSHLALLSRRQSWFREPRVYDFFDALNDDGFFDEFDTILFHGAGPGGYAACAYSVAAPGARVLAVTPQATLDPQVTAWDPRFPSARRHAFTDRYGYGPDMLDAAAAAWVLFDPREPLDAMHAALYARGAVTALKCPSMGGALAADLTAMGIRDALLREAMAGTLGPLSFARLHRARRTHLPYLRRLLARLEGDDRGGLVHRLCRNVAGRMDAPVFGRRLAQLDAAEADMPALRVRHA